MSQWHRCEPNDAALSGQTVDYVETDGADLMGRWSDFQRYWDNRLAADVDPFARVMTSRVGPEASVMTRANERLRGVNFASHDYLSLASHSDVCAAAIEAIGRWGLHSGGSVSLQGGSVPLMALEQHLAETWKCREATVFPTGWSACYGVIKALVRDADHVLLDGRVNGGLREGAFNATSNVHVLSDFAPEAIEDLLVRIRRRSGQAGILVVTEALSQVDSTVPDLRMLQEVCHSFEATLLVDVSHDFGAIGPGGTGFLGQQGMLRQVDLVVGSLSETFASNGGFVASSAIGIKQAMRTILGPMMFTSALTPVQASVIDAALSVARSPEGAKRRRILMRNAKRLREGLAACAFRVWGEPSPIVPVWAGPTDRARLITGAVLRAGALVNLTEYPVVPIGASRWRLQVMSAHTPAQIDRVVAIVAAARREVGPMPRLLQVHDGQGSGG